MSEVIGQTKEKFLRAKGRILHTLETTPDDRLNWSPSEAARTPLQQVGHAADAIKNMKNMFCGIPFHAKTMDEAEQHFRDRDKEFTSKETVVQLFEANCAEYEAWLGSLTEDQLSTMVEMPFGFGMMPLSATIGFPADHTLWHVAQMEYMQTIYGDYDWHM